MAVLTNQGKDYIASRALESSEFDIVQIVLANVPNLDYKTPVPLDEDWPAAYRIEGEFNITSKGLINSNQVVYSIVLDTNVGDFSFNWIGLKSDTGVLVGAAYLPTQEKVRTNGEVQGNNITRNFVIEYENIADLVPFNVQAETWQLDQTLWFKNQLDKIHELGKYTLGDSVILHDDFFKHDGFYSGFVTFTGGTLIHEGVSYVCESNGISLGTDLMYIYAYTWLEKTVIGWQPKIEIVETSIYHSAGSEVNHWGVFKKAIPLWRFENNQEPEDLRPKVLDGGSLLSYIDSRELALKTFFKNAGNISEGTLSNERINSASTSNKGICQLSSSISSTSESVAATPKAVNSSILAGAVKAFTDSSGFVDVISSSGSITSDFGYEWVYLTTEQTNNLILPNRFYILDASFNAGTDSFNTAQTVFYIDSDFKTSTTSTKTLVDLSDMYPHLVDYDGDNVGKMSIDYLKVNLGIRYSSSNSRVEFFIKCYEEKFNQNTNIDRHGMEWSMDNRSNGSYSFNIKRIEFK